MKHIKFCEQFAINALYSIDEKKCMILYLIISILFSSILLMNRKQGSSLTQVNWFCPARRVKPGLPRILLEASSAHHVCYTYRHSSRCWDSTPVYSSYTRRCWRSVPSCHTRHTTLDTSDNVTSCRHGWACNRPDKCYIRRYRHCWRNMWRRSLDKLWRVNWYRVSDNCGDCMYTLLFINMYVLFFNNNK